VPQVVDPAVSRAKFDREIADYRKMEATYRKRGWFLLDAEFPEIFVAFAATKIRPSPIVAAVVLDFSNYDLQPPSVCFVDPFTREPLTTQNLQIQMLRRSKGPEAPPEAANTVLPEGEVQVTSMIQANAPGDRPFICLPGIREYHDNPAHTGDSWLLHRTSGEGSLAFILEKIWSYGVDPLSALLVQVQVQVPFLTPIRNAEAIPE